MAVIIQPTNSNSVSVSQGGSVQAGLTIKKSTGGSLNSLSNVVTTNLQDGYTLVYDSQTNKWVAQAITSSVAAVDGGTF